jgi:RNA polymerase sigma factor (sigma-70 family)
MEREEHLENELLDALAQDIAGTFPQLIDAYYSQLYGFVVGQVRSPQIAEDIMQDSWIRIFQALDRYPATRIRELQLRPWLFSVVRNQMLTSLGKKNGANIPLIEDSDNGVKDDGTLLLEEVFELKERVEEIRLVVEQLPPSYCRVLTLYLFEGLRYQEIADREGQSVNNVRTYVSRGMKLLREKLAASIN